jgi:hypothetical protein
MYLVGLHLSINTSDRNNALWFAPGHEYKLLSLLGMNALGLPGNWFWRVGLVVRSFYYLEASPKGSSLKRFLCYKKK